MSTSLKASAEQPSSLVNDLVFQGLTSAQEAYCHARMNGLDPSDAYRAAYDCSRMQATTIYQRAHESERHSKIKERLRQLVTERSQQTSLVPKVDRAFVLEGIVHLAMHGVKDTTRLRAFELLGKVAGVDLFKGNDDSMPKPRDINDIDSELKAALSRILPTIDGQARRIDPLNDTQSPIIDAEPVNNHDIVIDASAQLGPRQVDRRRKPKS